MNNKPLVWLDGEVKTPPFSREARLKAGFLLRELQGGELIAMPDSRPMPGIGKHCHELRVNDRESGKTWRIVYKIYTDAIVILEIFAKKTNQTPKNVIDVCKLRIKQYDEVTK